MGPVRSYALYAAVYHRHGFCNPVCLCAELVNGRLAMLGFVWASINEAQTGEMFMNQFMHAPVQDFLWVALWVYASMVPIMHGAILEPFGLSLIHISEPTRPY